jgi:hypothetical protein
MRDLQREQWKEQIALQKASAGAAASYAEKMKQATIDQALLAQAVEATQVNANELFRDIEKAIKELLIWLKGGGKGSAYSTAPSIGGNTSQIVDGTTVADSMQPIYYSNSAWNNTVIDQNQQQSSTSGNGTQIINVYVGNERLAEFVVETIEREINVR